MRFNVMFATAACVLFLIKEKEFLRNCLFSYICSITQHSDGEGVGMK